MGWHDAVGWHDPVTGSAGHERGEAADAQRERAERGFVEQAGVVFERYRSPASHAHRGTSRPARVRIVEAERPFHFDPRRRPGESTVRGNIRVGQKLNGHSAKPESTSQHRANTPNRLHRSRMLPPPETERFVTL